MLIKTKISLAVMLSVLSIGAIAADYEDDDVLYPSGTIADLQPKVYFQYDATKAGYYIDLVSLNDEFGDDPATAKSTDNTCGEVISTTFIPQGSSDISCGETELPNGTAIITGTACAWLVPSNLETGKYYGVQVEPTNLDDTNDGMDGLPSREDPNCAGDATPNTEDTSVGRHKSPYQTFKVDTSTVTVVVPENRPDKVVITSSGECIDDAAGDDDCKITFTHANAPAASWYAVWVTDKFGVRVNPRVLSDQGDGGTPWIADDKGWVKLSGTPLADLDETAPDNQINLTCQTNLAGVRTCALRMDNTNSAFLAMPASGNPYKVWINAWNGAGTAGWSFPGEFDK